jgi:hypothetical protein
MRGGEGGEGNDGGVKEAKLSIVAALILWRHWIPCFLKASVGNATRHKDLTCFGMDAKVMKSYILG